MPKYTITAESTKNMPWESRPEKTHGVLWRYSGNPIIKRNPTEHCVRVFNSALVPYGDGFMGVFRADHPSGGMRIHLARSKNGIDWDIEDEVIKWTDENGKPFQPQYGYDPRLVKMGDTYFIMWCTSFDWQPTIGMGYTKDFKTFTRKENAFLPFNRNGVLFPRKINGNYMLLSRPSDNGHTPFGDIFISESPDLTYWGKHRKVMKTNSQSSWQSLKIGAGPIPIETSEGWLMIYHGVNLTCNGYVYSMGAALLDIENPSKVLYRTRPYLLTPEVDYETIGYVQNVAFPCAALLDADDGRIAIYYGAADTYVGIAFGYIDEIIDFTKSNSQLVAGDADIGRD
ncbi:MAG: glycoside hydrolase family 130 protein [Defluviitaleaceae bacterium]|nr:glycoside hydrolase family 130 protein [Defluviitaleaceae bacterium]